MCRRALGCVALTLAALAAPLATSAQQTEQELVHQLDSLLPLLKQASIDATAAREARRQEMEAKQPTESLEVGLVHVLVPPGTAAAAQEVVGAVWERDFARVVDRSPSLELDRLYFEWAVQPKEYRPSSVRIHKVVARRWRTRSEMERAVQHVIGASLASDLTDTPLQTEWGVGAVVPPQSPESIYRQVAATPSKAAQACVSGNAGQCLVMMGLVGGGNPMDLYTPQERRLLVLRQLSRFGHYLEDAGRCRDGSTQACDAAIQGYVQQWHDTRWAIPVLPEVRTSLLWYALEQGGAGAWGRLLDHSGEEPLQALVAASGMDADALARGWQAWLEEQHPASHAGLGSLTLGVLFWTLVLITLSMRSTRWRLA